MIIATLITLALAISAYWLTMRYNMHMLQLNTYLNNEQFEWIKRNFHLQWILAFAMLLGLLVMPIGLARSSALSVIAIVLIWLTLAVIIVVYRLMREMYSKKPLVFTARVKRMIVTISIICAILLLIPLAKGLGHDANLRASSFTAINGFMLWLVGSQLFMGMLANAVNTPIEKGIRKYYINDAKRILAKNPDLTIIGVTGSYGKTSVKFYLETLLRAKYSVLVTPESYNTPMGVVKTIREQLKPSHEVFICEMGARYVGEIKELCDLVHPSHGIIASIGPQHLDTFGSIENIQATKFELADALPEGGILFLNGDNEYISDYLANNLEKMRASGDAFPPSYENSVIYHADRQDAADEKKNTYGKSDNGKTVAGDEYFASDVKVTSLGTDFIAHAPGGESAEFSMKLIGAHNVINVMGAITVSHKMGIPLEDLRIPVRRLSSVPHRMEMKTQGDVTIIDDAFNSNPIGSRAAVETLALFDGLRILITPGMVELGPHEDEYNKKFGEYAAAACDYILLVGGSHTDPIKEGAIGAGFSKDKCLDFDRVEDAIKHAYGIKADGHKYILLENDLPDNYS